MSREIEQKFHIPGPEQVRQRLRAAGARRESAVFETNWILDTPERALLGRGCGLRVRSAHDIARDARRCTLTFKGPLTPGRLKDREEHELEISDAVEMRSVLAVLGFTEAVRFEKRRETWHGGDAAGRITVVVDELPRAGWFVEIEAPTAALVAQWAEVLELPDAAIEPETYVAIAARLGCRTPDGRLELCFAD